VAVPAARVPQDANVAAVFVALVDHVLPTGARCEVDARRPGHAHGLVYLPLGRVLRVDIIELTVPAKQD
jgi:hypothetical protein